jgi:hypothetical protein
MTEWDYKYLKKDSFPTGFEHGYADTVAGVVRTGLAIVGVVALVFAIGFCAGYFWGVR